MNIFELPRCRDCEQVYAKADGHNQYSLEGNINGCFMHGVQTFVKRCCYVSFNLGGLQGNRIDEELRDMIVQSMTSPIKYVLVGDNTSYMVHQLKSKKIQTYTTSSGKWAITNNIHINEYSDQYQFITLSKYNSLQQQQK